MKPNILERTTLYKGRFLELQNLKIDADTINYEIFNRPKGANGIFALAFTKERELILIEEYRPAIDAIVISLSCGAFNPSESIEENARRELLEETGFKAGRAFEITKSIGSIPATPGMCTEQQYYVALLDCEKVNAGGGLASEQEHIDTIRVPVSQLPAYLETECKKGKRVYAVHLALGLMQMHYPKLWRELIG